MQLYCWPTIKWWLAAKNNFKQRGCSQEGVAWMWKMYIQRNMVTVYWSHNYHKRLAQIWRVAILLISDSLRPITIQNPHFPLYIRMNVIDIIWKFTGEESGATFWIFWQIVIFWILWFLHISWQASQQSVGHCTILIIVSSMFLYVVFILLVATRSNFPTKIFLSSTKLVFWCSKDHAYELFENQLTLVFCIHFVIFCPNFSIRRA